MHWDRDTVEAWLENAFDVLERVPDLEFRYLRNALRSRFTPVVHDTATAYAADQARTVRAVPSGLEIDRMEAVLLGKPKRNLIGLGRNHKPWLDHLTRPRSKLVWRRVTGCPWRTISVFEHRSERTCQRWYGESLQCIADELRTLR